MVSHSQRDGFEFQLRGCLQTKDSHFLGEVQGKKEASRGKDRRGWKESRKKLVPKLGGRVHT